MSIKAIVTGHSRGLGKAIAISLAQAGVEVLGLSRGRAPELGDKVRQVEIDLADINALDALVASGAIARFFEDARTVLLVNNAGTVEPVGPAGSAGVAAVGRAVALNVAAPLALCDAVVAATRPGQDRRILHVSSGAGRRPVAGWGVYCATKAALDHHVRALVLDAVPGLRLCSLAPGVVDTDMQGTIRSASAEAFPDIEEFRAMKETGALASPQAAAARLVRHLLGPDFGAEPIADLRNL